MRVFDLLSLTGGGCVMQYHPPCTACASRKSPRICATISTPKPKPKTSHPTNEALVAKKMIIRKLCRGEGLDDMIAPQSALSTKRKQQLCE